MSSYLVDLPEGPREFQHVVLDFTGTLSVDGALIPGVGRRLQALSDQLELTVLTADTFGTARGALEGLPVAVRIIADGHEKAEIVASIGAQATVAIGNGRNDIPMVQAASLGIAILGPEGAPGALLMSADVVVSDVRDALDLLLNPLRLKATLRE
jgi:P-type E1-E2 ATPase